jgi:hypothetical protein
MGPQGSLAGSFMFPASRLEVKNMKIKKILFPFLNKNREMEKLSVHRFLEVVFFLLIAVILIFLWTQLNSVQYNSFKGCALLQNSQQGITDCASVYKVDSLQNFILALLISIVLYYILQVVYFKIVLWIIFGKKKELKTVGVVFGIVTSLCFSNVALAAFDHDLYYGTENDEQVTNLQKFLTSEGLYSGPITGNYYSLTQEAVKGFQQREGIYPTSGYFGPKTRARLNEISTVDDVGLVISSQSNTNASDIISRLESLKRQLSEILGNKTAPSVVATSENVPLEIYPISVIPTENSAKILWGTNQSTESKVFISNNVFLSKNIGTNHVVEISNLVSNTDYPYTISAIGTNGLTTKNGVFKTLKAQPVFSPEVIFDKEKVKADGNDGVQITINTRFSDGSAAAKRIMKIVETKRFNQYGSSKEEFSIVSDEFGLAVKYFPVEKVLRNYNRCGYEFSPSLGFNVVDLEEGKTIAEKNISIEPITINIPTSPVFGVCP